MMICALVVSGVSVSADSGVNYCLAPNTQDATPEAAANACIPPDTIAAAQTACDSIDAGQVCLGAGAVQTTPANALALVGEAIAATEACYPRVLGKVMGWLSQKTRGRAVGRRVSELVTRALAGAPAELSD